MNSQKQNKKKLYFNKNNNKNDNKKLDTSSNKRVEKSDNDLTYAKYGDDFLDMEIKTPEIKKIKEDINLSKENFLQVKEYYFKKKYLNRILESIKS